MASKLESDLGDTLERGRKWFVDFNAGKSQLVSFDRSNNTGATDAIEVALYLYKSAIWPCM